MGVEIMLGLTMARVEVACRVSDLLDEIRFTSTCGRTFLLHHHQSCCENVCIEDIAGDVDDLVGAPLLMAEEVTSVAEEHESGTWTFYKFATINGFVTVRWLGTSNGYYYSESVDFEEVE